MSAADLLPNFTAAQIAAALGRSKRGVLSALDNVAPHGERLQRGGKAAVWRMDQLPDAWRDSLAEAARQRGYRDTVHLLAGPSEPWQPRIGGAVVKLSDVAEHCIADAQRMQRALLPSLARLTGLSPAPAAEAEAKGLAEYQSVFGHRVSTGHWRRLVNRTVDRDGVAQDFSRLELFLAAKLARRPQTAPGYVAAGHHLESLRLALSGVGRPATPTAQELQSIWCQAFDELLWLIDEGTPQKAAERTVFDALNGSGIRLARTPDALKKSFGRKLARWQAGGCKPSALHDGRRIERTDAKLALPDADRQTLIARAVERGGRLSQAWREVRQAGELSPEMHSRYIDNPTGKSYVPRSVRESVKHEVALLEDIHHGPRQAKLNGPFIPRDWSDTTPGDWVQHDDCTLPVYYWEETLEGVRAMRGQFLLAVDVKTSLILGFALHSERNYNAAIIRSLIVRVHDSYGLPREGFHWEMGLWKRSRLLKGRAADEVTMEETELGLREFVRFMHAKLPRGKVIERILGLMQNEMDPLPGYVGRNEQTEKFERIQKQLLHAASGKIAYSSFLWSKEQWIEVLAGLCERFNDDPQGGRLNGQSPREAYENGFDYKSPLTKLPDHSRYLLANHRRKEKVTKNGIRIVMGGDPNYYRNAETGRLIGREVLVWLDPENIDSITITDLQRRNAVAVPRVEALPAMTATSDQLNAAHAQAAAHLSHARTLYRIIQPKFKRSMFRKNMVDAATIETGKQIAAGQAQVRIEKDRKQQLTRRVAVAERQAGVRFAKPHRNLERKLDGLEMLRRADELERQEGGKP